MILWIVIAILWTVLVLMAGYSAGKQSSKQEVKHVTENSTVMGYDWLDDAKFRDDIKQTVITLTQRVSSVDAQVQALDEKHQITAQEASPGTLRRLEEIEPLLARVAQLEERDRAYQDRFRRVEKKAGMSV